MSILDYSEDEAEREAARPANGLYTGIDCQFCRRNRVYKRMDGRFICEKCERFQVEPADTGAK